MASNRVALNDAAYEGLKRIRGPGESFSDAVLKILPRPKARTCGELLDELERDFEGVRLFDPELIEQVKAGRGRRSNRPAPRQKL